MSIQFRFRESALLVIDVQEQFSAPWSSDLPGRISSYVHTLNGSGVLFIYTKTIGDPERVPENVKRFREIRGFSPGAMSSSPRAALCSMFIPPEALIVEKPCFDAFAFTSLREHLRSQGIRSILLSGVMTDVCVEATARRAVMEGFDACILRDLVAAPEDHSLNVKRALSFFESYYGYVLPSTEISWERA
jgi:nicotinamidase-related amidase